MTELKPCPFCGADASFEGWNFIQGFRFYCNGCAAIIQLRPSLVVFEKKSEKEIDEMASIYWNRRSYE